MDGRPDEQQAVTGQAVSISLLTYSLVSYHCVAYTVDARLGLPPRQVTLSQLLQSEISLLNTVMS